MTLNAPFTNGYLNRISPRRAAASLESRLEGTTTTRIMAEIVGGSALFPILDGIRSISEEGVAAYFLEYSHYVLWIAAIIQAVYLGRVKNRSWMQTFLGNLIGVSIYTLVEILFEGMTFFQTPYHLVFWEYSAIMAVLRAWQQSAREHAVIIPTILLNLTRAGLLSAIYFIIELGTNASLQSITWATFTEFMQSPMHQYIVFGAFFFGLLMGLAEAQILNYAAFLRQAAKRLKEYSAWFLDGGLINSGFDNPDAFNLRRVEKSVLFMDIRGFTAWAEQTDPVQTVSVLNQYYNLAEKIITRFKGHKPGFTADEVMTRFDDPAQAIAAARALQSKLIPFLKSYGLAVGIGVHTGVLMEGLLGSNTTRKFDIIGDTVNTAKRLESAARGGEILISTATRRALTQDVDVKETRALNLKGKQQPVTTFSLTP